jgi:uncharacterized membrane protein YeaQ/YmgE (transglycosylase-associated protein family)
MRLNRKIVIITGLIAGVSFLLAAGINQPNSFLVNVLLGIFGSSVLTMLTSIVSYNQEKQQILENFWRYTLQLLSFLNRFTDCENLDDKVQFYIGYVDLDKTAWDMEYGRIDFFFDVQNRKRDYIYKNIYEPLHDFDAAIKKHESEFRGYLKGNNNNRTAITFFSDELESKLCEKIETTSLRGCKCTQTKPKLTVQVYQKLFGDYYSLMYGRKARKMEESKDGQP